MRANSTDGLGIIEISLLRHVRKSEVMIHEKDERAPLRGRKLEADRGALREKRAGFRMRPRPDGPAGIVQEQGEIEDERILEFFKELAVRSQFRILRLHDLVELVDADQRVFVRGVTMEKLVLHETGELPELRNVAAEKIDAVHHPEHAADFAFAAK